MLFYLLSHIFHSCPGAFVCLRQSDLKMSSEIKSTPSVDEDKGSESGHLQAMSRSWRRMLLFERSYPALPANNLPDPNNPSATQDHIGAPAAGNKAPVKLNQTQLRGRDDRDMKEDAQDPTVVNGEGSENNISLVSSSGTQWELYCDLDGDI